MAYESVKNQIDAYIKANGVNLITGQVLNAVLTTMLDELGEGYAFQGVLNTTDTPSPAADIPQAWLASAGSYLGGSITVDEGELALIIHTADGWSKETVYRGVQLSYEAIVAALEYTPASEYRVDSLEAYVVENYQPKLESGENIKTINGESIIGEGDIETQRIDTVQVTVDDNTGTPSATGSVSGSTLSLDFHNLKGAQGPKGDTGATGPQGNTGSSVDYPFELVNNLTTGGVDKALTAEQGVRIKELLDIGYKYIGVATLTTNPGTPDQNVFYIAGPGTYPNFNGAVIADGSLGVLKYNGAWAFESVPVGRDYSDDIEQIRKTVIGDFYLPTALQFAEYNSSIEEIFFNPYYLNNITIIDFRNYNGTIFCTTNLWSFSKSIRAYVNGDIIPLVVTTAGGNAAVGDVVGYVIFKDIATFRETSYGGVNKNPLNLLFVQRLQNAPTIAAYLQIQKQNIIKWYIPNTSIPAVAIYESCISELFLKPYASIGLVSVRNYSANLFVDFKTSGGTLITFVKVPLARYSDGEIIPITVSTEAGGFSVGDIIGYVIFKDIATFKATDYGGSTAYVNLDNVNNVENTPVILSSLVFPDEDTKPIYIPNTSIPAVAIYESCISELWINSQYGNTGYYSFKTYDVASFLDYIETDKSFQCRIELDNYSNGDIIPMVVTTSGGNAAIGDVVGYVIFKDIATFRETSYGSAARLNTKRIFSLLDNQTIWNGTTVTPDTVEQIVDSKLSSDIDFLLPSVIYAAVGVELNIYNDTVALSMDKGLVSPTNYIVRWDCNKGTVTSRCFRYTPQLADIGDVALTCYIYNIWGVLLESKTVTIKVVAAQISSSKRVVFFGDSTGAGSANALYNDFNDSSLFSGTKPTMLGVRGTTPKYEAFGGARWSDYATEGRAAFRCQVTGVGSIALGSTYTNNGTTWTIVEVNVTSGVGNILITCNQLMPPTLYPQTDGVLVSTTGGANINYTGATLEPGNPLWYNNAIDFAHYRNTLGLTANEKLDLVSFQLGLNGQESNDILRQYIIDLYNAAIADNPNCIFVIGLITGPANEIGAYGVNYGAGNWMSSITLFQRRRKLYVELVESGDYPNMRIATPNLNIDRYFGFPMDTRAVSSRNTTQEQYLTNYVHPNTTGYAQIGDSFFSAYVALLNN